MEPEGPAGYRLLRVTRWDGLASAPPSQDQRTRVEAPSAQLRDTLADLFAQGNWADLLRRSQQAFVSNGNHLWLDLQRYTHSACANLAGGYEAVADAVCAETAAFVTRLNGVADLRFSDGTSFADSTTREWLQQVMEPQTDRGTGDDNPAGPVEQYELEHRAVKHMVGAGKCSDALALLRRGVEGSANEEANFRRKALMGRVLLAAGKPDVAVAVLESLSSKIDLHGLERWAPEIAIEALTQLHKAYGELQSRNPRRAPTDIAEKRYSVHSAISRIDPARACALHR